MTSTPVTVSKINHTRTATRQHFICTRMIRIIPLPRDSSLPETLPGRSPPLPKETPARSPPYRRRPRAPSPQKSGVPTRKTASSEGIRQWQYLGYYCIRLDKKQNASDGKYIQYHITEVSHSHYSEGDEYMYHLDPEPVFWNVTADALVIIKKTHTHTIKWARLSAPLEEFRKVRTPPPLPNVQP